MKRKLRFTDSTTDMINEEVTEEAGITEASVQPWQFTKQDKATAVYLKYTKYRGIVCRVFWERLQEQNDETENNMTNEGKKVRR